MCVGGFLVKEQDLPGDACSAGKDRVRQARNPEDKDTGREREVSLRNKICLLDAFVRQIRIITFIVTTGEEGEERRRRGERRKKRTEESGEGEDEDEGPKSACSFIILR
jgi:hypothetical protein